MVAFFLQVPESYRKGESFLSKYVPSFCVLKRAVENVLNVWPKVPSGFQIVWDVLTVKAGTSHFLHFSHPGSLCPLDEELLSWKRASSNISSQDKGYKSQLCNNLRRPFQLNCSSKYAPQRIRATTSANLCATCTESIETRLSIQVSSICHQSDGLTLCLSSSAYGHERGTDCNHPG